MHRRRDDHNIRRFLSSFEGADRTGRWNDMGCLLVEILRLLNLVKAFYNSSLELHAEYVTWERFRTAFRERFKDAHTYQYNFIKLQTSRDEKMKNHRNSQTTVGVMFNVNDPVAQWIHRGKVKRTCMASLLAGLTGNPGRQVRFANPKYMQQALKIAVAVTEAERQEKVSEIFLRGLISQLITPRGLQAERIGNKKTLDRCMTHARAVNRINSHVVLQKTPRTGQP